MDMADSGFSPAHRHTDRDNDIVFGNRRNGPVGSGGTMGRICRIRNPFPLWLACRKSE